MSSATSAASASATSNDSRHEGDAANYRGTDYIGKFGLEESYEQQLHGITGLRGSRDGLRRAAVRTLARESAGLGQQSGAQPRRAPAGDGREPSATVAARWSRSSRRRAGCSPSCRKPGFDPNLFVDGIDPQNWDALNNSPDKPLNNRALARHYPPGSTFKPFMALAALELGKRTPAVHDLATPGYFTLPA